MCLQISPAAQVQLTRKQNTCKAPNGECHGGTDGRISSLPEKSAAWIPFLWKRHGVFVCVYRMHMQYSGDYIKSQPTGQKIYCRILGGWGRWES